MGQPDSSTKTTDDAEGPKAGLDASPATEAKLADHLETADAWLKDRRKFTLVALLLLAGFLRLITWMELEDGPCFYHYEHDQMDMLYFHKWAKGINDESLLSDFKKPDSRDLRHPLHDWHWQVAKNYLIDNPQAIGGKDFETEPIEAKLAAVKAQWDHWYRGKQFHQEPLYPYMLAGIYASVGEREQEPGQFRNMPRGVVVMYCLQSILGVLSIGLIYLLARRYFGDLAAVLTAGLAIGYAPLIYFEFILLRASWICFAGLLLVWLAERLRDQQTSARWLGFGLATGIVVMLKTTMLLFGLGAAVIILLPQRKDHGLVLRKLGLMAAGSLIALSPVIIRNLAVGAPTLSMTSVGAVTFAASNYSDYLPSEGWSPRATTVAEIMGESKGRLSATVPATIATHDSVIAYGWLLVEKFTQIWHWFEVPNNAKFYLYQLYSKVLQWLPAPFWTTAPFAIYGLGLVLLRRREERRSSALLTLLIATIILPMVAFYVLSRFRVPMVVAMSPFAAYGILALLKETRRRHLLWTGLGLLLCMLLINREIPTRQGQPARETVNYFDIQNHMIDFWGPKIQLAEKDKDYPLAAELLTQFLDTMPAKVRRVSATEPPTEQLQVMMARDYGSGYLRLAQTMEKAGLQVRASRAKRRGDELLAAAKVGQDLLDESNPTLQRQKALQAELDKQRSEGYRVIVILNPPLDRADTIAVIDQLGAVQPLWSHDRPQKPAKRGATLHEGKTEVLIIGTEAHSIILFKNGQEIGRKQIPPGMIKIKDLANTIRV